MTRSEPIWQLRNAVGVRTVCFIVQVADGHVLLVRRDDGGAIVSEHHDAPQSALERAGAIYRDLINKGWVRVSDVS